MISIIALSTAALQRCRPSLKTRTEELDDAGQDVVLTPPYLLKRRDRSGSHSRGRGDRGSKGMPGDGNNGDGQDDPGHCSKHPHSPNCRASSGSRSSDSSTAASSDPVSASSSTTGSTPALSSDISGLGSTSSSPSSSWSSLSLSASSIMGTFSDSTSTVTPPASLTSLTPETIGFGGVESSSSSSPQAAAASHAHKTGAIVGGVIGGIVLLVLAILGTILFLRQRRRKRTPASAEFRDRYIPRSTAPPLPLAAQTSAENLDELGGPPPPFTPGDFKDPLFEKIRETQQAHVTYGLAR